MTEEEIRDIFSFHGLDPAKVKIYEPFFRPEAQAREYRFDYSIDGGVFDWHFLIPVENEHHELMIRAFVVKGVRKLREKLAA